MVRGASAVYKPEAPERELRGEGPGLSKGFKTVPNSKDQKEKSAGANLVSDMVVGAAKKSPSAELVVEPETPPAETDSFAQELERTLRETEQAVIGLEGSESDAVQGKSWQKARALVAEFRPVPLFIWRLSNFVLGKPGVINKASEGLVFGLRRLLFAAASDPVLGVGRKVNDVRSALDVLPADVVAACAVIHAISRRLPSKQFERIWRPILDDAVLRAQIGLYVGREDPSFGAGRGMLAGFAGRCGLAMLISSGELDQARKALEMLATGAEIKNVGLALYGCDPLQISAMTLSASGCGRDAAFGTVSYSSAGGSSSGDKIASAPTSQKAWYAAFFITEHIRTGRSEKISSEIWDLLGISDDTVRASITEKSKLALRRGHGWNWLAGTE